MNKGKQIWLAKIKSTRPYVLPLLLTVGFCILDSLLWGSTVGYPSDSLASCSVSSLKILLHHNLLWNQIAID